MDWILGILWLAIYIGCPVFLIVGVCSAPWYLHLLYVVWLVCCVVTIAHPIRRDREWYGKMGYAFLATTVFTLVLFSAAGGFSVNVSEDAYYYLALPALNLPAVYWIGKQIGMKWCETVDRQTREFNEEVDRQIEDRKGRILCLERELKEKSVPKHIIALLGRCGEDVSDFSGNANVQSRSRELKQIASEIKRLKQEVLELKRSKR